MSTLAIVISLLLLMFFAYRGIFRIDFGSHPWRLWDIAIGHMVYMIRNTDLHGGFGRLYFKILPISLLGALFGQLMVDSGGRPAFHWICKTWSKRAS